MSEIEREEKKLNRTKINASKFQPTTSGLSMATVWNGNKKMQNLSSFFMQLKYVQLFLIILPMSTIFQAHFLSIICNRYITTLNDTKMNEKKCYSQWNVEKVP